MVSRALTSSFVGIYRAGRYAFTVSVFGTYAAFPSDSIYMLKLFTTPILLLRYPSLCPGLEDAHSAASSKVTVSNNGKCVIQNLSNRLSSFSPDSYLKPLVQTSKELCAPLIEKQKRRGIRPRALRAMVCGIPNVAINPPYISFFLYLY